MPEILCSIFILDSLLCAGKGSLNGTEQAGDGSGKKDLLKLVMNPAGQIQDINTLRKQGYSFETALSPEVCLEIVKGLNSPKGKGIYTIKILSSGIEIYTFRS